MSGALFQVWPGARYSLNRPITPIKDFNDVPVNVYVNIHGRIGRRIRFIASIDSVGGFQGCQCERRCPSVLENAGPEGSVPAPPTGFQRETAAVGFAINHGRAAHRD